MPVWRCQLLSDRTRREALFWAPSRFNSGQVEVEFKQTYPPFRPMHYCPSATAQTIVDLGALNGASQASSGTVSVLPAVVLIVITATNVLSSPLPRLASSVYSRKVRRLQPRVSSGGRRRSTMVHFRKPAWIHPSFESEAGAVVPKSGWRHEPCWHSQSSMRSSILVWPPPRSMISGDSIPQRRYTP